MVSTRQMSTSSSGIVGNFTANSILFNALVDSNSTRPSVVTRQSNTLSVINSTIATAALTSVFNSTPAAPTSSSTAASTAQQTQEFKVNESVKNCLKMGCNQGQMSSINFLDLPVEILSHIISYIGYKKVGQLRVISHRMNDVCKHILNSTFIILITKTFNRFQIIKANMPRRESARRNHPLACECDIIETCYMRLSLLQMTFGKHIERGHCCFFPGAILDEVYTILNYIKTATCLERPYRVTDELFDLSTMAMEYFRDSIEPTLPGIGYFSKDFFKLPTTTKRSSELSDSATSLPSPPQSNMVLRKGIRKIKQGMKIYNNQLSVLRNELRTCKRKSVEQAKQITEQQKLLAEQRKQTLEYANRLDENDKKNEELSRKFSTLLQELNKCKTELQYWRSKSPATPTCTSCGNNVTANLPPEDYQALINQGIKPEDIILNLNDSGDAENDIRINDNSNEFVFPDDTTTAKLLTVNMAAKNLKRQHTIIEVAATKKPTTTSHIQNNNNAKLTQNNETELTEFYDFNEASTSSSAFIATSGYSTKLFYGSSNSTKRATTITTVPHKSVIVSPQSQLKRIVVNSYNKQLQVPNVHVNIYKDTVNNNEASNSCLISSTPALEDVNNIQAITSNETKKTRRVQKTIRCLNNSSNKCK